jgi:pyruvate formate lyase activating enzyme
MDTEKHKQWTGVGNRRILQNLEALAGTGADIQVRIPLIRGVNSDEQNIEATAAYVAALPGPRKAVRLLPYHNLAEGKSVKLGREYDPGVMAAPDEEEIERVITQFAAHGLTAAVGG